MPFPDFLHKYRFFDKEGFHLRLLTHNEIYFSSPACFNDPFDCRIPLDYSEGTKEEITQYWKAHLSNPNSKLPAEFKAANVEQLYDSGFFTSVSARKNARNYSRNFGLKALGIFSLSADEANILMWSHYSHSHSGFLVSYRTQRLREYCHQSTFEDGHITALDRVRYEPLIPKANAYRHDRNERFEQQFLTKAEDWSYEKECRILRHNAPNTNAVISGDAIHKVVLGCQIESADTQLIIDVLKARGDHLPLLRAILSETRFGFDFEQVRY